MEWRQAECGREILCGERAGGVLMQGDLRTADLTGFAGKVQCVYLDPPFFTGDEFEFRMRIGEKGWTDGSQTLTLKAYSDSRTGGRAQYLLLLREALRVAYDLLSDTGALFLHLDSRMNAYARLECDQVFGENNFVNEIIWAYQSGGRAKRHFSRKHDVILFYAKSRALYFDITRVGVPRKDNRSNHMRRTVDEHGRPCRTIRAGGKVYTYYDDEPVFPDDVWTDVSHLQQKDPQRTGYDTQKPIRLLERIILSCSKPGDLVMDLFAGSGTTLEAAYLSGRRFVGVDVSPYALQVSRRRLIGANVRYSAPPSQGNPEVELSIVPAIAYYEVTLEKYQLESGLIARSLTGLDAVDGWSAGYLRDGVFVAMTHDNRSRHQPRLKGVLQLPVLSGVPCVRVTDVMGRVFYYIIKPEEV